MAKVGGSFGLFVRVRVRAQNANASEVSIDRVRSIVGTTARVQSKIYCCLP